MVYQTEFTNKPLADFKAGKISKSEASKKLKKNMKAVKIFGGGSSSSSLNSSLKKLAQFEAQAQAQALAKAQAKAKALALSKAQAEQKRIELSRTREQRIQELIEQNRQMGILSSRRNAENIIRIREASEIRNAQREARARAMATGEIQIAKPSKIRDAREYIINQGGVKNTIINTTKKGIKSYEKNVVIPIRKANPNLGNTPIGILSKNIRNEGVIKGSKTTGKKYYNQYETNVVTPIAKTEFFQKNIKPTALKSISKSRETIKSLKKNLNLYKENVVIPFSKTKTSKFIGKPFRDIAEAKLIINSKKSGEMVKIGMGSNVRYVNVDTLKGGGLIDFGEKIILGEVEETFTDIGRKARFDKGLSPEQFGKGVKYLTAGAFLSTGGAFVGEQLAKITEAELTQGYFGGSKSGLKYVKENPIEVALAGGMVIGSTIRYAKGSNLRKLGKFTEEPLYKKVTLEPSKVNLNKQGDIYARQFKGRGYNEKTFVKYVGKKRGNINIEMNIPSENKIYTGTFKEKRKTGNLFKREKDYFGDVSIDKEGNLIETLKINNRLKRTTKVDRYGKGLISLEKNGKEIIKKEIKDSSIPSYNFKETILKGSSKEILGGGGSEEELIIRGLEGKKLKYKKSIGNLNTKVLTKDTKIILSSGKDIKKGLTIETFIEDTIEDTLKVGSRKGIKSIKENNLNILYKKQIAPKIEFVESSAIESESKFFIKNDRETLSKIISPIQKRNIKRNIDEKIIVEYINPKLTKKSSKVITKKYKESVSQWDKVLKKETNRQEGIKLNNKIDKLTINSNKKLSDRLLLIDKLKQNSIKLKDKIIVKPARSILGDFKSEGFNQDIVFGINKDTKYESKLFGINLKGKTKQATVQTNISKTDLDQDIITKQITSTLTSQKNASKQITSTLTSQKNASKQISRTELKQKRINKTQFGIGLISKIPKKKYPNYPYNYFKPKFPSRIRIKPIFKVKKKSKPIFKEEDTFEVLIKRRGRLITGGKNLTKGQAVRQLEQSLTKTLARTGYIRKTGKKKQVFSVDSLGTPNELIFRDYQIKRGKKIPLARGYIQRTSANLQTISEKKAIQRAKRLNRLIGVKL